MAAPLERAFIEIVAETEGFEDQLEDGIRDAMKNTRRLIERSLERIEGRFEKAGAVIRKELGTTLNLPQFRGERGIQRVIGLLEELGDEGREAAAVIERELSDSLLSVSARAERATERAEASFEDLSGTIRQALGRVAFSGLDDLESNAQRAAADVAQHFERMSADVRESIGDIANAPGLDGLENQVRDVASTLERHMARATNEALRGLNRLGSTRDLSTLNRDIMRIAQSFEGDLGGAISEANARLDLLSGEGLDRLRVDVTRSAEEMEELARNSRRAADGIDAAARHGRTLFRSLNSSSAAIRNIQFLLAGAGIGFALERLSEFGIEAGSGLEQAQLSLQTIGSQIEGVPFDQLETQAAGALETVIDFAQRTPFAVNEVTDSVRRLTAFLPSFNLEPTINDVTTLQGATDEAVDIFANLSSGLAVLGQQDALPRLVKGLGDVGAAGRLTGEEVRQLRNALPGVEVRSGIIQGILDPIRDVSPQVQDLAQHFRDLGATGTDVPQKVLQEFVELQAQGLIPAEAVIAGLESTLNRLGQGEAGLERFTETIAGQIEKIRESAQVSLGRSFLPLTDVLVENLDTINDSVADFGDVFADGIVDVIEDGIPVAADLVETLGEVFEEFFDVTSDFLQENGPQLERAFEAIGDVIIRFLPTLSRLSDVGLDVFVSSMEIGEPIIFAMAEALELLADVLDTIPDEVLGSLVVSFLAFRQIDRVERILGGAARGLDMIASVISRLPAGGRVAGLANALSRLQNINLKGFQPFSAGALTGAGVGAAIGFFANQEIEARAATAAAERFQQVLDDVAAGVMSDPNEFRGFVVLEEQIARVDAELRDLQERAAGGSQGNLFQRGSSGMLEGLQNLGSIATFGNIERTHAQLQADLEEAQRLSNELATQQANNAASIAAAFDEVELGVSDAISRQIQQQFGGDASFADLGIDESTIAEFLDGLGVLGGGFNEVQSAIADAAAEAGGFDQLIRDLGGTLPRVFEDAASEVQDFATGLQQTLDALAEQQTAMMEATNPVFAALDAQQAYEDSLAALREGGENAPDLLEVVRSRLNADAAAAELATTGVSLDDAIAQVTNSLQGTELEAQLGEISTTLATETADIATRIGQMADNFNLDFAEGVPAAIATGVDAAAIEMQRLSEEAGKAVESTSAVIPSAGEAGADIGAALAEGIIAGMEARRNQVAAAARSISAAASGAMRREQRIRSPSKETEEIGRYIAEGLAVGMRKNLALVNAAARALANAGTPRVSPVGVTSGDVASRASGATSRDAGATSTVESSSRTTVHAPINVVQRSGESPDMFAERIADQIVQKASV